MIVRQRCGSKSLLNALRVCGPWLYGRLSRGSRKQKNGPPSTSLQRTLADPLRKAILMNHIRPIEVVVNAISKATGKKPDWSGSECRICCPAHEDRKPSLSITEGEDGRVLMKCWAGCGFEEILNAARLQKSDLFPEPDRNTSAPTFGNPARPKRMTLKPGWPTSLALIENL